MLYASRNVWLQTEHLTSLPVRFACATVLGTLNKVLHLGQRAFILCVTPKIPTGFRWHVARYACYLSAQVM